MNRSKAIGESGLRSAQFWIDTIAHNIANLSTHGYRRRETEFESALNTALDQGALPTLMIGSGVKADQVTVDQRQGSLQATGRMLDLGLDGSGFFVLRAPDGEVHYTRDGTFYVDGRGSLTAADGSYVLNVEDQPIQLGAEPGEIDISGGGELAREGSDEVLGRLKLVRFKNPEKLVSVGQQRFQASEASGAPVSISEAGGTEVRVHQGYRETSNVSLATELTHLMIAERAFQLAARIVQEGDQLDDLAGDLTR